MIRNTKFLNCENHPLGITSPLILKQKNLSLREQPGPDFLSEFTPETFTFWVYSQTMLNKLGEKYLFTKTSPINKCEMG